MTARITIPARSGLLAAVILAALSSAAGAPAATAEPACGDTITTDTTLHADLMDCPVHGLVIGADDVTLDLNGHTIDGDAVPATGNPDVGVLSEGHDQVRIENGTVQEFDLGAFLDAAAGGRILDLTVRRSANAGILARGSTGTRIAGNDTSASGFAGINLIESEHGTVVRNSSRDNVLFGISAFAGGSNVIERNVVSDNDDVGIIFGFGSERNRITRNAVSGNAFAGILLDGASRNAILRNRVAGNGDGIAVAGDANRVLQNDVTDTVGCDQECGIGISMEGGSGNLVAHNAVRRTARMGIRLDGYLQPAAVNVFRANVVRDAGTDGISVGTDQIGPIDGTVLERNIAIGAADDGFDVDSASTTLTHNLARRNGDLGIEAVPGVTDGGGNRAFGNGNPAQCTNVTC